MSKTIILSLFLILSIQECGPSYKLDLCAVDREERVFIEDPYDRHGGGVYIFNEKFYFDFREVELSYEKNERLSKIIRNNFTLLKDSNTVEILFFNKEDSVWIREQEMFSKDSVLLKNCIIKERE